MHRLRRLALVGLVWPWLCGFETDPGLLIEVDLGAFELTSEDLRSHEAGPGFVVVTGSPRHRTPSGDFAIDLLVHNPGWRPGDTARSYGAEPIPPSMDGPLGIGKIAFAADGILLHGGADPLVLGKPVSLGCVRVLDPDFAKLVHWFKAQQALAEPRLQANGEVHQSFARPIRIVVTGPR